MWQSSEEQKCSTISSSTVEFTKNDQILAISIYGSNLWKFYIFLKNSSLWFDSHFHGRSMEVNLIKVYLASSINK